ncbi:hypothetical protein [Nocardia xishanensis]
MTEDPNAPRRTFLIEELKALRTSSELLLFAFDRVINFGLVFAAGATGLALANSAKIVLILLPFPIAILYLILINMNTEGLSRAGHKRWVEEELDLLLGGKSAIEECAVAPTRQGRFWFGRFSVFGTQILLGVMLVTFFIVGFVKIFSERWYWTLLYAIGAILCFTLLFLAVRELTSAYDRAYQAAKRYRR